MATTCTTYQVTNISEFEVIVGYTDCIQGSVDVALAAGDTMFVCASAAPKPNVALQITSQEECTPCYNCPEGTTLEGSECVDVEIVAATYSGATFPVVAGDKISSYNKFGIRLYPDITAMTFPLYAYGANASWQIYQNDGAGAIVSPTHSVQSALWGCDSVSNPTCGTGNVGGRLNKAGVWATGFPNYTELPFSFCVDLDATKQYLIGIAGDNKVKIYIDNVLHVYLDATLTLHGASTSSVTKPFNHWHVFPITLPAGAHEIKLVGLNIDGTKGFAGEVYDIDLATFQATLLDPATTAPNCGNTEADLLPYIVFSTKDYIGMTIPDPSDPNGTWVCPDGYALDECSGAPTCTLITKTTAEPCCYKLTSCDNPEVFYYTQENLAGYVGQIIQLGGQACYYVTLNVSEECIDPIVGLNITGSFGSCIQCAPFYALRNCSTGEVVEINGQPAYFEVFQETNTVPNPDFFLDRQILSLEIDQAVWNGCGYFERVLNDPGTTIDWAQVLTLTERPLPAEPVYKLTNCSTGQELYTDSLDFEDAAINGLTVRVLENSDCWSVTKTADCCLTMIPLTIDKCFNDCDECFEALPCICTILTNTDVGPIAYRYIDCENVLRSIVVSAGVSTPKMCVKQWLPGGLRSIVEFGDCVNGECPKPTINPRAYAPEWNPSHCSEEHIIDVSCRFANLMHDKMMARRFKIETCCPENELEATVNYELLQLELITHPGICDTIIQLGCICLTLNNGVDPIQQITMCADPTNTFYTSQSGDAIIRFAPQRCRWELYLVQNNTEVLYQTIGSEGLPPIGTWNPLDPPLDAVVITSTSGSCV